MTQFQIEGRGMVLGVTKFPLDDSTQKFGQISLHKIELTNHNLKMYAILKTGNGKRGQLAG